MKSEWRVGMKYFRGIEIYEVYRVIDTSKINNRENREYYESDFLSEEDAKAKADQLNSNWGFKRI